MKRFLMVAAAALFCMVGAVEAKTYDYRLWVYNTNLGPDSPGLELKFYNVQTERITYPVPENPGIPNYFREKFIISGDVDFYLKTWGRAIKGTGTAAFSREIYTSNVYNSEGEEFISLYGNLIADTGETSGLSKSGKYYFKLAETPGPYQLSDEYNAIEDKSDSFPDLRLFRELYQVNAYKGGPLPVPLPASGLLLLAGLLVGARPRRHRPL